MQSWWADGWVQFNVPLDMSHSTRYQVISETIFYRPDDTTNSVKALKESG